jgi:hypothetical protein
MQERSKRGKLLLFLKGSEDKMTKQCTMKEAFVKRKLDEFQPGWRNGEDITAETKQKIREYVASKMPEEFKDDAACLTDYSIRNMANKIRERENLPKPKRTNKGNAKVAVTEPSNSEGQELKTQNNTDNKESSCQQNQGEKSSTTFTFDSLKNVIKYLVDKYSLEAVKKALAESQGITL